MSTSLLLTFLIADVRGYTRFTVDHGDEAAASLASHFADLCEEVVEAHQGRVIELRGDEALADDPRFQMLGLIREYAAEALAETTYANLVRQRHAEYFAAIAQEGNVYLRDSVKTPWLDRLEQEHANVRAAIQWFMDSGQNETALQVTTYLWSFWWVRGHLGEGCRQLETALARSPDAASSLRAAALHGAGMLTLHRGYLERARPMLEESVSLARQVGDGVLLGDALMSQALCAQSMGQEETAAILYDESLKLARSLGRPQRIAILTRQLGTIACLQGDYRRAAELLHDSVLIHRELDDIRELSFDYSSLGMLADV